MISPPRASLLVVLAHPDDEIFHGGAGIYGTVTQVGRLAVGQSVTLHGSGRRSEIWNAGSI